MSFKGRVMVFAYDEKGLEYIAHESTYENINICNKRDMVFKYDTSGKIIEIAPDGSQYLTLDCSTSKKFNTVDESKMNRTA